jgi:cysteine synthase
VALHGRLRGELVTLRSPFRSCIDCFELPRLVRLEKNLVAGAFTLMKLLPARFMLEKAVAAGEIGPETLVIETSSGTFGLALAIVSRLRGHRLIVIGDPVIDVNLVRKLEHLGASVSIVTEPAPVGGFQRARLDRVCELQEQHPDHYTPNQYDNANNPNSYGSVAELLVETLGQIDCLVGTVGSGGSVCGTARFLRTLFPDLNVVGVDTPGSVLFGTPDQPRLLRGLGNSIFPRNVDHETFDEIHWVGAAEAFAATHELYRRYCLYMGPTSGAAWLVASWWARSNPDANVVVFLPDEGHRYETTIYDPKWLGAKVGVLPELDEPLEVGGPDEVSDGWSSMAWGRRSLDDVTANIAVGAR